MTSATSQPRPTSTTAGSPRPDTRVGWIDATAGASGDMLLGAAIEAGASLETVNCALAALNLSDQLSVRTETVARAGIRATRAIVDAPDTAHSRPWSVIREILAAADLAPTVAARATRAFELLAHAEAWVHGVAPDNVIFHEVGGLDALADIVGVSAALDELGLDGIGCSAIAVGSGEVVTAHGTLSVPTPATIRLLAEMGATIGGTSMAHEACTPTGAALLAANVDRDGPPPELNVNVVGTGAGSRDPSDRPNVLRLILGTLPSVRKLSEAGAVLEPRVELAANVDDTDPRVWPYVIERCLAAGADDAWITPIWMKKARPAVSIRVLCGESLTGAMGAILVSETSTIGYRVRKVYKVALRRSTVTVQVGGFPVRVKIAYDEGGGQVNVAAEYEDAATAARSCGLALREVLHQAVARAQLEVESEQE